MAAPRTERITLELEPGETIRGRLLDRSGAVHHFHGWLELSGALERVWERAGLERAGLDLAGERQDVYEEAGGCS